MIEKQQRRLFKLVLGLSIVLLFFAALSQFWIASRIPLWGDELDTIVPSFRVWKGHKDFFWQLGQYNVAAPGEYLLLRGLYRSQYLEWFHQLSPELFWRLPNIFVYCTTAFVAFIGVWNWTRSALVSFLAFLYLATSWGTVLYANEVRYYTWLVFFFNSTIWLFLPLMDKLHGKSDHRRRYTWLYYFFSIVVSIGVWFHVMMAAIAYMMLVYGIFWCAQEIYFLKRAKRLKSLSITDGGRVFLHLFFGALPFILYKVEVKHFLFVPPAWPNLPSPWPRVFQMQTWNHMISLMHSNLPFREWLPHDWFWHMLLAFAAIGLFGAFRGNWARCFQSVFFASLNLLLPIVMFVNSESRNVPLNGRYFIYCIPLMCGSLIFIFKAIWLDFWQQVVGHFPRTLVAGLSALLFVVFSFGAMYFSVHAADGFAQNAKNLSFSSPAKGTYPLRTWREFFRHLPDAKPLVIVGTRPDARANASDNGGYTAGNLIYYTNEFHPVFLSTHGSFNEQMDLDSKVAQRIFSAPNHFDFLVLDDPGRTEAQHPKLPWSRFKCTAYLKQGFGLRFCRL